MKPFWSEASTPRRVTPQEQVAALEQDLHLSQMKLNEAQAENKSLKLKISNFRADLSLLEASIDELSGELTTVQLQSDTYRSRATLAGRDIETMIESLQRMKSEYYENGCQANAALSFIRRWNSTKLELKPEVNPFLDEEKQRGMNRLAVLRHLREGWREKVKEMRVKVDQQRSYNEKVYAAFGRLKEKLGLGTDRDVAQKVTSVYTTHSTTQARLDNMTKKTSENEASLRATQGAIHSLRTSEAEELESNSRKKETLQQQVKQVRKERDLKEVAIREVELTFKNELTPAIAPLFSLFSQLRLQHTVSVSTNFIPGEALSSSHFLPILHELDDKMTQFFSLLSSLRKHTALDLSQLPRKSWRKIVIVPPSMEDEGKKAGETARRRVKGRKKAGKYSKNCLGSRLLGL